MAPRYLAGVAVAAVALVTAGCGSERTVVGSGRILTHAISVPEFSRIDAKEAFEVRLSTGAASRVVVHADDNVLPELDVHVSGETLHLKLKSGVSTKRATMRADVALPALDRVDGSEAAQVEGKVSIKEAKIDLSGASRARLSGSAEKLEVHADGASGLDSPELTVRALEIHLSGASTAEVTVTSTLSADLSGASSLRYRGSAEVTHQHVSGGSSLVHF